MKESALILHKNKTNELYTSLLKKISHKLKREKLQHSNIQGVTAEKFKESKNKKKKQTRRQL